MAILLTLSSVLAEVAIVDETGSPLHDTFALPLLDFSPYMRAEGVVVDEPPTAEQRATARELDQVARAHGFVALTRFGVDRALLQRAWNESARLFALPPERKRALAPISAETNRGHSGLGRESLNRNRAGEPKEAFNVRRAGNNYSGVPDGFEHVAEMLWARLELAARRYALAAAVALGLPRDYFHATLREHGQSSHVGSTMSQSPPKAPGSGRVKLNTPKQTGTVKYPVKADAAGYQKSPAS